MRITCETKDTLPLSALTEFQGGLKKRTADDTKKIEKSINDYGFATPFFVWKHDGINSVLDGHGRLQTLKEMQKRGEEHPTMKPVKLFQRLIKNSSKEDAAVLDPFGGSGTTIIACEKLGRTAYVMELDPHYCDVIRRRWTQWAAENDVDAGSGSLE